MDKLLDELAEATENLHHAARRASLARAEETDATNRLNAAQKAVDAQMAELRAKAPRGSDWADRGRQRGEVVS